jgi:NADP-dependent 3-hydroxy acid dehydrogenase YdfG
MACGVICMRCCQGTLNVINAFLPLMRQDGKIINVSSAASVSALNKMSPELREKFLNCTTIDEVRHARMHSQSVHLG